MNRFVTQLLLAASAGLLVGCGDKPAPIIEAREIEKPKVIDTELKPPAKPEASDPAAKQLLGEMLAAHTDGKPDKLAALRECSFTRKGAADTPVGRLNAVWKRDLIWPDRYRIRLETSDTSGTKSTQTYALRGDVAWFQLGDDPNPKAKMAPGVVPNLRGQFHEDCLTLLFVLAEPKTLVAKAPELKLNGKELTTLDVWTPNGDHARLGIDKTTKMLVHIVYVGQEASSQSESYAVTKELTLSEFKEFAGVKLATKVQARTKAKPLGEWTDLTLDVVKPDPKLFDGP